MEKRGIIILIVAALILIIVAVNFSNKSTGNITGTTKGASYGSLSTEYNKYKNCSYVAEDDEWDVMKKTTIQYYNTTGGGPFYIEDTCNGYKVVEYNCDNGYRKRIYVICPDNMVCKDGACVLE